MSGDFAARAVTVRAVTVRLLLSLKKSETRSSTREQACLIDFLGNGVACFAFFGARNFWEFDSRPRTRSAGAELVRAISGSHPADPLSLGRSGRGGFAAVLAAERCIVGDLRQIRELPWKGDIRMRWS